MAGRWFENFRIEQVFEREIRRTVTASDNVTFTTATMNSAAIHIDAEYCKTTEFGRPLVNSIFTLGLGIGLSVQDTTLGTTLPNSAYPKRASASRASCFRRPTPQRHADRDRLRGPCRH